MACANGDFRQILYSTALDGSCCLTVNSITSIPAISNGKLMMHGGSVAVLCPASEHKAPADRAELFSPAWSEIE